MSRYVTPLPLDLNVTIRHRDSGAQGTVVDVFDDYAVIDGTLRVWPVYVVQFDGYSSNGTARQWARDGFEVVEG